jgi:hypothetical protein
VQLDNVRSKEAKTSGRPHWWRNFNASSIARVKTSRGVSKLLPAPKQSAVVRA